MHPNVLGRFPHHLDPLIRPEQFEVPEEKLLIFPPQLVDGIVLGEFATRIDTSFASNLLDPLDDRGVASEELASTSRRREYTGRMMHDSRPLDPNDWRANHYVQLLGRPTVYANEAKFQELRMFNFHDEAAEALGNAMAG